MPSNQKSADLDKSILSTALPAMVNLAVVPVVSTIETMWIGRMGIALALAGQSAAKSAYLTSFFLVSFLPTMAAPLVASAVGSGNKKEAQEKICDTLFLCNVFGLFGTILLSCFPDLVLRLVLSPDAPAMEYARPYLRYEAFCMIPALVSATGFAAFRGMLDTVTPLKISLACHFLKMCLDPIMIFKTPIGFVGVVCSSMLAESVAGMVNLRLLLKKGLAKVGLLFTPPKKKNLMPLLTGGVTMMARQIAINIALVSTTRYAQGLDRTGIAAAAYGIVNQMYTIGFVAHVAMQGAAAALVPSTLAKSGPTEARRMGDRIYGWSVAAGSFLAILQYLLLPYVIPAFTTLPEVQEAVKRPAQVACLLHLVNGPRFAGEGILMGLKGFFDLTAVTIVGSAIMVGCLQTKLGTSLAGVFTANVIFCSYQTIALFLHYLYVGPLSSRRSEKTPEKIE